MTLVDDARRLLSVGPRIRIDDPEDDSEHDVCGVCGEESPCPPICPWLAMPSIVAVLEAAERIAGRYGQLLFATDPDLEALAVAMGRDVEEVRADHCGICHSKVHSGIGLYPWTCTNGHTLYFGGGHLSTRNRTPPKTEAPA